MSGDRAGLSDVEVRERVQAVEALLARLEQLPGDGRAVALDTVQVLVELYGEALRRLLAHARTDGSDERDGRREGNLAELAAGDELLSHLMLLHGLHPATVETRVAEALADVRPLMSSRGGSAEIVSIEDGAVRVRLTGNGNGSPPEVLRQAVEQAILLRAPEIDRVVAEGLDLPDGAAFSDGAGFIPLESLRANGGRPRDGAPAPGPSAHRHGGSPGDEDR